MKFAVTVTLKKDVLDPQGKVVSQTLKNMGMNNLSQIRQGKFFEIDLKEKDPLKHIIKLKKCVKNYWLIKSLRILKLLKQNEIISNSFSWIKL